MDVSASRWLARPMRNASAFGCEEMCGRHAGARAAIRFNDCFKDWMGQSRGCKRDARVGGVHNITSKPHTYCCALCHHHFKIKTHRFMGTMGSLRRPNGSPFAFCPGKNGAGPGAPNRDPDLKFYSFNKHHVAPAGGFTSQHSTMYASGVDAKGQVNVSTSWHRREENSFSSWGRASSLAACGFYTL